MKNNEVKIAVTSRSFSENSILRKELLQRYKNVTFNDEGVKLQGDILVDFLKGHQRVITALEKIDNDLLTKLPELQVVS